MRAQLPTRGHRVVFSSVLMAALLLGLILPGGRVLAGSDRAHALQQRATARLDHYVDHFRRTFDRTALRPELATAEAELGTSVRLFQAAGDPGGTALSSIKLGDVHRYREEWNDAARAYQTAAVAVPCFALHPARCRPWWLVSAG
jgi:C4-dicarboxylate-specific signal transduction histidine kinase